MLLSIELAKSSARSQIVKIARTSLRFKNPHKETLNDKRS